jgi:hypothetical protein
MSISISIDIGEKESSSRVYFTGAEQHTITDEESVSFGLNDQQLKQAINRYFGQIPNNAYLHSDTPWGDLYKTYRWEQVSTNMVPYRADILEITSKPTIVKEQEFANNSRKLGTFNVSISESVNNTLLSTWNTGIKLTIGQKISYGILVKGETSLSYEQSWSIGGQRSQSVTVGSASGVSVLLAPGESILASLSASRGVMKVRIYYRAYLSGNSAVNYDPIFKGHHFWCLDINSVMAAGDISNNLLSTEDIEIGYYSNARIELKDKKTGALVAEHRLADLHG